MCFRKIHMWIWGKRNQDVRTCEMVLYGRSGIHRRSPWIFGHCSGVQIWRLDEYLRFGNDLNGRRLLDDILGVVFCSGYVEIFSLIHAKKCIDS